MAKKTTSTRSRSNTTRRTATGAQQYDRDTSLSGPSHRTFRSVRDAMQRDFRNMTPAEFRSKYGTNYGDAMHRLEASSWARNSEDIRSIRNRENGTTRMYDDFERGRSAAAANARSRGYAKGGLVKANCGASMKPNRKAKK